MLIPKTKSSFEVKAYANVNQILSLQSRYTNSKILWKSGRVLNVNAIYGLKQRFVLSIFTQNDIFQVVNNLLQNLRGIVRNVLCISNILSLTLVRMDLFGVAHWWGTKKASLPKICLTYTAIMKLGTVIP